MSSSSPPAWPPENPDRVFKTFLRDQAVWIKRSNKDYHNGFQRLVARLCNPADTGKSLRQEAMRIETMRELGVWSPEVLELGPDYIVLSDIGSSIQDLIRKADDPTRMARVTEGAQALEDLHRRGGWHGNAAMRNLVRDTESGRIGFVDFEGPLRDRLPLLLKQSYDFWQYCHSCSRFDVQGDLTHTAFMGYRLRRNKRVVIAVAILLAPFAFCMVPAAPILGRDVRQTIVTVKALLGKNLHS